MEASFSSHLNGFLLFHGIVEIATVAVCLSLFFLTWNTRAYLGNDYLKLIGSGYGFIGLVDLLHTLAYKGMGVFPGYGANLPTQLWIAARFLQAGTLCAAPLFITRRLNDRALLGGYAVAALGLTAWVFSGGFPDCYIEGKGLTPFKIGSEYAISAALLVALYLLSVKRDRFKKSVYLLVASSIGCTAASELSFTAYVGVYGFANGTGHLLKLAATYLLYRAILVTGLKDPFDLIFRELKQSERALQTARDGLEEQVGERTAKLEAANAKLGDEVAVRRRTEGELRRANRALHALSDCNQALIRASDETGLLSTICRIVVQDGGYRAAWVGFAEENEARTVRPAAQVGFDADILESVPISWADSEHGQGPAGKAIRTGRPCLVRDPGDDPVLAEMRRRGTGKDTTCTIGLPLAIEGKPRGVLCISAGGTYAFDDEEMELLKEMAGDLAFGIEALRSRSAHARAESALELFRRLADQSNDAIFVADPRTSRVLDANDTACRILGYSRERLLDLSVGDFDLAWKDASRWAEDLKALHAAGSVTRESRHRRRNGTTFPVEINVSHAVKDGTEYLIAVVRDITERKKAEETLRARGRELNESQRLAHIGGWDWDSSTDTIWWSDEYYRIYSIDPNLPTPKYGEHLKVYAPESRERLDAAVKRAMETGEAYELDLELAGPAGATRWICARGEAKRDSKGRILGLRGTAQDITERKRNEQKLALLNFALDNVREAAFLIGEDGRFRYVNEETCRVLGYSRDELLGLGVADIDPDFPRQRWPGHWNDLKTRPLTFESRHRARDGRLIPVEISANHFEYDGQGYNLALARDITERKRAEETLREREAFIRRILETVDESFVVVDRRYRVLSANKAYCDFVGRTEEQVLGRPCHEVSHRMDSPCFERGEECAVRRTFETGMPHAAAHTHIGRDGGRRYVETKSFPVLDASGNVVSAIETINDVTERRKLEEQLRHAQKLEALGTLAGGVAHDFNNILNVIVGYAGIMQMKTPPDDPNLPYVREILDASDRATQLTHALLVFSRKQVAERKPVSINDLVNSMKKMVLRIIGEDIETRIILAPGDLVVMGDQGQLVQVLMNFATNARDAMPDGGAMTIETGLVVLDEDFVRSHGFGKPGKYALVTVSDTGVGMDEKTRERIFEPFFTTKGPGKGTGLGLSIAYGIVDQHKGHINCYSEPGKGTAFKVYLPIVAEKLADAETEDLSPVRGGTETILVADDEENIRKLTTVLLESHGYTVLTAKDGVEAVDAFRENGEKVDLLLLDVVMPRKGGREAFEEIRVARPDVKTLFISGYSEDIVQRQKIIAEGLPYLRKPVKPRELLSRVRELLDGNRH